MRVRGLMIASTVYVYAYTYILTMCDNNIAAVCKMQSLVVIVLIKMLEPTEADYNAPMTILSNNTEHMEQQTCSKQNLLVNNPTCTRLPFTLLINWSF